MKRIVRLNENDLARIVRRVIRESEEDLVDEIDSALDSMDENSEDPGPLQRLIDKIEDAGHDVGMFMNKLRRNSMKFKRKLKRVFRNLRFKRKVDIRGMFNADGNPVSALDILVFINKNGGEIEKTKIPLDSYDIIKSEFESMIRKLPADNDISKKMTDIIDQIDEIQTGEIQ